MTLQTRPGQFRHTVILASTDKGFERFESLDAMPPLLRAQCLSALESCSSATVLIAGQAGEESRTTRESPAPPSSPVSSKQEDAVLVLWLRIAIAAAALCLLCWRA